MFILIHSLMLVCFEMVIQTMSNNGFNEKNNSYCHSPGLYFCPPTPFPASTKIILNLILRFMRKVLENFRILGSKDCLELLLYHLYERKNKWASTLKKNTSLHFLRDRVFPKFPKTSGDELFLSLPFSQLFMAHTLSDTVV